MQALLDSIAQSLNELTPAEFWTGFTFVVAASAYGFWLMYRSFHHARLIENIPTARVRSAPQGYVELIGEAEAMDGPVIVSPLSATVCLWFSYKIEEKVRHYSSRGGSRSHWRVVKTETSDELFLLRDETGECVIDPDDAEVITSNQRVWYNRKVVPVRRYTERLILQGEPLYVMGLFKSVANVQNQKIREQVSLLLRQWKQVPNLMLHRYDLDRDGEISPREWKKAHVDATNTVKREIGQQAKMKQLSIMRQSPHSDQPYIISTIAEGKLIARYKRHAYGAMLLFIAAGSFAVWAFNLRLGQ